MRLPVDLVVLSGCETGLGKQINGEGLLSLTRGFLYAGAARIVASLWSVSDVACQLNGGLLSGHGTRWHASRHRSASSPNPDVETEAMELPLLLGCLSDPGRLEMNS